MNHTVFLKTSILMADVNKINFKIYSNCYTILDSQECFFSHDVSLKKTTKYINTQHNVFV